MPTNLYGPNDNFDLNTSHVLAALLRKAHEAKMEKAEADRVGSESHAANFYRDDLTGASFSARAP